MISSKWDNIENWNRKNKKSYVKVNFIHNKKSAMKNKKILNIGLIGCGIVGLRRIKNLSNNFKLIGCADINISKKKFL